jgi:hypothetical protein
LGVPEVGENLTLVYCKLGIGVDGGIFGLGYGPYYYWYEGGVT